MILALASLRAYPRLKTAAAAVCVAAALLAGVHFSLAANTSFAWEWKSDADYKLLLSDLREMRGTAAPADRPIRLAIRWPSEAPLRYYVERDRLDWLTLQDIPQNEAPDLYFLSDAFDESRMVLVKNYPRSGHILVREK